MAALPGGADRGLTRRIILSHLGAHAGTRGSRRRGRHRPAHAAPAGPRRERACARRHRRSPSMSLAPSLLPFDLVATGGRRRRPLQSPDTRVRTCQCAGSRRPRLAQPDRMTTGTRRDARGDIIRCMRHVPLTRRQVLRGAAAGIAAAAAPGGRGAAGAMRQRDDIGPYADGVLPPGVRSRFVSNVNGLRMHVLEAGSKAGARAGVLLLHGFPELAYSWRRLMPALAAGGLSRHGARSARLRPHRRGPASATTTTCARSGC